MFGFLVQLASAVASVSVAAPASTSVAASVAAAASAPAASVVKGRLKVAQLGRPRQPLVLLGVAVPG